MPLSRGTFEIAVEGGPRACKSMNAGDWFVPIATIENVSTTASECPNL